MFQDFYPCESRSGVLDLHSEDTFVASGHPDRASVLSGIAPGPRIGSVVNVRTGFGLREVKEETFFERG